MKTDQDIFDWAEERGIEFKIPDGYPEAFMGIVRGGGGYGDEVRAVYSEAKVIEALVKQGMGREEAEEFYTFNIAGAFIEGGPLFVELCE